MKNFFHAKEISLRISSSSQLTFLGSMKLNSRLRGVRISSIRMDFTSSTKAWWDGFSLLFFTIHTPRRSRGGVDTFSLQVFLVWESITINSLFYFSTPLLMHGMSTGNSFLLSDFPCSIECMLRNSRYLVESLVSVLLLWMNLKAFNKSIIMEFQSHSAITVNQQHTYENVWQQDRFLTEKREEKSTSCWLYGIHSGVGVREFLSSNFSFFVWNVFNNSLLDFKKNFFLPFMFPAKLLYLQWWNSQLPSPCHLLFHLTT